VAWSDLPPAEPARLISRQGVRDLPLEGLDVLDPETLQPVSRDGQPTGGVMFRSNVVMKGYFRIELATKEAFEGGWFHSGDLGVIDPDG
jgi:fatty-acyl-CoA synthase